MNRLHSILFSALLLSLCVLYSCVTWEYQRMHFDLTSMRGEIEYINLISAIEEKETYWSNDEEKVAFFAELDSIRDEDLKSILADFGESSEDEFKKDVEKKLFKKRGKLNGLETFSFSDIEYFGIKISDDSTTYIHKLSDDQTYVGGNGTKSKSGEDEVITWPIDVKVIDIKLHNANLEEEFDFIESMLPYWKKWKRDNK